MRDPALKFFNASFADTFGKYLPKESLVIDVGAKVGTSVIAMASNNDKIEYLSIEADEYFFKLLKKNIERAKKKKNFKISILNEFIGKNITSVSLSGNGSTKPPLTRL